MKRLLNVAALTGLAITALGAGAQAQVTDRVTHTNSTAIKLGFYAPGKADARHAGGDQILAFEADYVVQSIPERNEISVLSLGYLERDGLRLVPLILSQLTLDRKRTSAYDFYYGWGVGLYSMRLDSDVTSGKNKVMPGLSATLGMQLSTKNFIEFRYHLLSHYETKSLDGFSLMFGRRL